MNASILRGVAVRALICHSQPTMNSSYRLLSIGCVFVLAIFFTAPARALILLSESRSVFVSYYGSGIETHSSDGNFGLFDATAIGVPYGGGSVFVRQLSNITTQVIRVEQWAYDGYGPGAVGRSDFQVRFSLPEPTPFTVSASTWSYPGLATLVSDTLGTIPVHWPYGFGGVLNSMDLMLAAGTYTFTAGVHYGDGIHTIYELRVPNVPDRGATASMLAVGLLSLVAVRAQMLSSKPQT